MVGPLLVSGILLPLVLAAGVLAEANLALGGSIDTAAAEAAGSFGEGWEAGRSYGLKFTLEDVEATDWGGRIGELETMNLYDGFIYVRSVMGELRADVRAGVRKAGGEASPPCDAMDGLDGHERADCVRPRLQRLRSQP